MAPTISDADVGGVPFAPHSDALTVLKCAPGFFASKQIIARDGEEPEIRGFNAGMWFQQHQWPVSNIVGLWSALTALETMPNCLVIRGAPAQGLDCSRAQRRNKANYRTPARGRLWGLIDVDKLRLPDGLRLSDGVELVCEYLVTLLPPEFHQASYLWQLSSSVGVSDPSVVSMHLWFWFDRPIPDADLKYWANTWNRTNADGVGGKPIIDTHLFNDVQAHFTAAPRFVGMADPFPMRCGLVRKAVDEVALRLPARSTQSKSRPLADTSLQGSRGFEAILAEIGDHPNGGGFHTPIIRAAASYVATHGREDTDVEALYQVIRDRVLAADRSKHDEAHVLAMAGREHIVRAIEEALVKYGGPSPQRKSRRLEGIPPHFASAPVSAAIAKENLREVVHAFFRVR